MRDYPELPAQLVCLVIYVLELMLRINHELALVADVFWQVIQKGVVVVDLHPNWRILLDEGVGYFPVVILSELVFEAAGGDEGAVGVVDGWFFWREELVD